MENLSDYVQWFGRSLGVFLDDDEIEELTTWILENDKYSSFVRQLSDKIISMQLDTPPFDRMLTLIYIDDYRKQSGK